MSESSLSAVERVVEGVKSGIRAGRYSPGQRLVEVDLASELKVSRNTLRDGIQRLLAEGLVHVERYKGASVRKMSKAELVELTVIRATLEGLGASSAAGRSRADREAAFEDIRQNYQDRDLLNVDVYRRYNAEFHDAITRLSGISRLPSFIEMTKLSMMRLYFDAVILKPERMTTSLKEHDRIETAILRGRADEAEAAMRLHVGRTSEIILTAPDQFFSES